MFKKLGLFLALAMAAMTLPAGITPAAAETGVASWFGDLRITASGRSYSPRQAGIAAHKSIPLGSLVKVTRTSTGKSLIVRIVDRGPYIRGRIIDLTPAGARALGFYDSGVTKVTISIIERGNTRSWLRANYGKGPAYATVTRKNRNVGGAPRAKKRNAG
jgi:rare lipoprotein A